VRIRVVSWNVDSRPTGLLDAKVELLRTLRPDLALLQEIGRPVYRALLPHPSAHERMHRKSRQFSWGALSTDLAEPRASEFRLGCAVLGVSTTALLDAHVLNSAPFDVRDPVLPGFLWRTVAAQVALSTGAMLTVCSFHGRQPSGLPDAALQRAFHRGIAGWLASVPGPVLFGIDAGPLVLDGADPLLGPTPVHGLHDVLRATHDHLWATRDLAVLDVQCLPDDAAAAGSDHAVLVADLELRDS
jgi:endonuclease/exonuclease/phosphatase family metal-dependent hydrolase